ncbi:MAG: restriction endonuclease subunit S [Flavobacteriia bacterium]|nr:restriction endonuclease subunit S [Flavobacteriia bacterium]
MDKLQPILRFPEFKDFLASRIIGDVCNLTTGNKDTQNKIEDGLYPFFVRSQTVERINSFTFDGEAILTSGDGVGVGKNYHYINGKFDFHQRVYCLCNFKEGIYGKFVFHYFSENFLKRITRMNAKNSVDSVRREMIFDMPINLPTLPEQTKIANFLTSVDEKLNLLKEKKEALEEYKKGMMQKIFSQEIRFKDENGKDFMDWEEKTLVEIGEVINGLTYSPDNICSDGILVLRSSNIKNKRLAFVDNVYVNTTKFNPVIENDILICVRNGSRNLIGKNVIIPKEIEGVAFGAFMTVYRSNLNKYLIHWFDSEDYKQNVNINLGATINSINGSDLRKFIVPIPSIQEQIKIADFLTAIDEKIELISIQIEDTQEYKKGLLQQMFC